MTGKWRRAVLFVLVTLDFAIALYVFTWIGFFYLDRYGTPLGYGIYITLCILVPFLWWLFAVRTPARSPDGLTVMKKPSSVRPLVAWGIRIGGLVGFTARSLYLSYYTLFGTVENKPHGFGDLPTDMFDAVTDIMVFAGAVALYAWLFVWRPYKKLRRRNQS